MKQNKKGDILIPAVLLLCLLVVFGLALMSMTLSSANLSVKSQSAQQAYYSAKSVTDEVVALLVSQEADNKAQHDALLAQVLAMTQGQEATASDVTLAGLPGQDAKLTVTCTRYDDTQPGVTVHTFRIWAQVTVDTYVRSVSRMVTVTRTMVTEKASAAGLIVNNAQANVTIKGGVNGSVFIQNAKSCQLTGGNKNTDGILVDGGVYVNTQNAANDGGITLNDITVKGDTVLASSGAVEIKEANFGDTGTGIGGSLYVNTSNGGTLNGRYSTVKLTDSTVNGNMVVPASSTFTFETVTVKGELHANATTGIELKDASIDAGVTTLHTDNDAAITVNDAAWAGSTSVYTAPADDTTEDVFKAENAVTAAQLVSKDGAQVLDIPNGGTANVDVNANGSSICNVVLQQFKNSNSSRTLKVTGMGTLNIFLDEADSSWSFKNFNISVPQDGTININIIQTGGGTLQIDGTGSGVVNANFIIANGGLKIAQNAKISGVVVCLGDGDVFVENNTETAIDGKVAWADFSAAFAEGTNLDAYLGADGQQKEVITFTTGKYGT